MCLIEDADSILFYELTKIFVISEYGCVQNSEFFLSGYIHHRLISGKIREIGIIVESGSPLLMFYEELPILLQGHR